MKRKKSYLLYKELTRLLLLFLSDCVGTVSYARECLSCNTQADNSQGIIGPQFDPRISPKLHFSILNQHPSVNALSASPQQKRDKFNGLNLFPLMSFFALLFPKLTSHELSIKCIDRLVPNKLDNGKHFASLVRFWSILL